MNPLQAQSLSNGASGLDPSQWTLHRFATFVVLRPCCSPFYTATPLIYASGPVTLAPRAAVMPAFPCLPIQLTQSPHHLDPALWQTIALRSCSQEITADAPGMVPSPAASDCLPARCATTPAAMPSPGTPILTSTTPAAAPG